MSERLTALLSIASTLLLALLVGFTCGRLERRERRPEDETGGEP